MKRRPTSKPLNRRGGKPSGGQQHLLDVRVRRSTARRQRSHRLTRLVAGAIVWLGVGAATYFGFIAVVGKFFLTNPEYDLRTVTVESGNLLTRDEVMRVAGVEFGTNIFKIDLGAAERELRRIRQIESVRIERNWPDSLVIEIKKRHPVAWLARASSEAFSSENSLLVDAGGALMEPYKIEPDFWRLPVISCPDPQLIASGDTLAIADLAAALELLAEHGRNPQSLLHIRSVDITRGYAIEITTDSNAKIFFAPAAPAPQLARLDKLLDHCIETGRQLEMANLVPKKYTPVRFLMASAREALPAGGETEVPR